jgi:hypothetical protein
MEDVEKMMDTLRFRDPGLEKSKVGEAEQIQHIRDTLHLPLALQGKKIWGKKPHNARLYHQLVWV